MTEKFRISKSIKSLIIKYDSKFVNIFFWFFIISFFIDRIINYFVHFPFFVGSAILIFPFLFIAAQYKNPERQQLIVLVFSFIIITIINSIVYSFGVKNISDLLFIILFITHYYYYKHKINYLRPLNVYVFLILSLFLFSFTFIGVDSNPIIKPEFSLSINNWNNPTDIKFKKYSTEKSDTLWVSNQEKLKYIAENRETNIWKPKPLHILEELRVYHNGLFRITHIASYFFGFLFLFFAYRYQKKKKIFDIIFLIICLVFGVYTGSKTVLLVFVLSIILYFLIRRNFIYLLILFFVSVLLFYEREYILQITENTILYPYSVFIYISAENLTTLSRFLIWNSWYTEISEFGFRDLMIGKSFTNSLIANEKNINCKIWFHNDFLNIFYTYGVWGTLLYIWFFVKIYRDNKVVIKQNIFIFIFYFSMTFTAILNGFYYYFPVFLLYIFFLMIKNEKQSLLG